MLGKAELKNRYLNALRSQLRLEEQALQRWRELGAINGDIHAWSLEEQLREARVDSLKAQVEFFEPAGE